jgi:hypothetical protein
VPEVSDTEFRSELSGIVYLRHFINFKVLGTCYI